MDGSPPRLGVNIDHVATVRQARRADEPDPVTAAALATLAGAEIITLHLREDRRHVQDRDLRLLRETVFTKLNLEMALTPDIVDLAIAVGPEQVTLVPEKRQELTTEGGLDVARLDAGAITLLGRLREAGMIVSVFVDPEPAQIEASAAAGALFVELHTGPYATARPEDREAELVRLEKAAAAAVAHGLGVNAGHGLTYFNVGNLVRRLAVEELHIGHSIVARAVLVGMQRAVAEMVEVIHRHWTSAQVGRRTP